MRAQAAVGPAGGGLPHHPDSAPPQPRCSIKAGKDGNPGPCGPSSGSPCLGTSQLTLELPAFAHHAGHQGPGLWGQTSLCWSLDGEVLGRCHGPDPSGPAAFGRDRESGSEDEEAERSEGWRPRTTRAHRPPSLPGDQLVGEAGTLRFTSSFHAVGMKVPSGCKLEVCEMTPRAVLCVPGDGGRTAPPPHVPTAAVQTGQVHALPGSLL